MKKLKYVWSMIFLVAFAVLFNFTAFAGTWQQVDNTWYYCNLNGSLAANCWVGEYYVGGDGKPFETSTYKATYSFEKENEKSVIIKSDGTKFYKINGEPQ